MPNKYFINYQKGGKLLDLIFYEIFKDVLDENDAIKYSNMFAIDYVNSFENGLNEEIDEDTLKNKFKMLLEKYKINMNEEQINIIFSTKKDDIERIKRNLEIEKARKNFELTTFERNLNQNLDFSFENTSDLIAKNLNKYKDHYIDLYYQNQIDEKIMNDLKVLFEFEKDINYEKFIKYLEYYQNNSKFSTRVKYCLDNCINYVLDNNFYEKFIYSIQKTREGYTITNLYNKMILTNNEFNKLLSKNTFFKIHQNNLESLKKFISDNYQNILEYYSNIKTTLFDELYKLKEKDPNNIYNNLELTNIEFKHNRTIDNIMENFKGEIKTLDKKASKSYDFFKYNDDGLKNNISNAAIFFNSEFIKIEKFFSKHKLSELIAKEGEYYDKNLKEEVLDSGTKFYYISDDIFKFEEEEVALSKAILANMKDPYFFKIFNLEYDLDGIKHSFNSIKAKINKDISIDGSIYENHILDDVYKRTIGLLNYNFRNIMEKLIEKYRKEGNEYKELNYRNKLKDNVYKSNSLRILNGYSFSNENNDDNVKGELDVMIIDNDNNLLAVGEIKSYIDGIFKAYNQLIRFGKFIKDKDSLIIFKNDKRITINITGDFKEKIEKYILTPELNRYFFIILKDLRFSNIPEGNKEIYNTISQLMKKNIISFDGDKFNISDDEVTKEEKNKIINNFETFRNNTIRESGTDTLTLLGKYKLDENKYRNNLIIYK